MQGIEIEEVPVRTKPGRILDDLVEGCGAVGAILVSKSGVKIAHSGQMSDFNPHTAAALMAGTFVGQQKVAEMLGEDEIVIALQQGKNRHVQTSRITDDVFLVVIFEGTERIGRVRFSVSRIEEPMRKALEYTQEQTRRLEGSLGEGFGRSVMGLLDDTFETR